MSEWRAERLSKLPPYLFVELERKVRQAVDAGRDVIDFGIGDPDRPTPRFIVDRMAEAIKNSAHHQYAPSIGIESFRTAAAAFIKKRFSVDLDPTREVISLLGTKEGIGHLPTAVVNPGEVVLVPDPGYPVYTSGSIFAGAQCHTMTLRESDDWLPVFDEIPDEVRGRAKVMYLNYPNNPTAACAPRSFFEEAVAFAREHRILIVQDAAYSELYFDKPPLSILQIEGAKDVCIEMHSLSKTFNMTGWRIGFAAGNADALSALAAVKSNVDSGVFGAIQEAGITALRNVDHPDIREQLNIYRGRRDVLVSGLREASWQVKPPQATFYLWARCPAGCDSMSLAGRLLEEADVVAIPGVGFGTGGEGYVRFALTVDEERTGEAVGRIGRMQW